MLKRRDLAPRKRDHEEVHEVRQAATIAAAALQRRLPTDRSDSGRGPSTSSGGGSPPASSTSSSIRGDRPLGRAVWHGYRHRSRSMAKERASVDGQIRSRRCVPQPQPREPQPGSWHGRAAGDILRRSPFRSCAGFGPAGISNEHQVPHGNLALQPDLRRREPGAQYRDQRSAYPFRRDRALCG